MSKLRLLDLFCCAGGAGAGYAQAGFEVVGVDLYRQPRYPFEFIQADALTLTPGWIARNFDAVHASPPCQFATPLKHAPNGKTHPNLIPGTRKLLKAAGLPYVIENVEKAREHLVNPVMLCGTMFDLGAEGCQLQRHRLFEASFKLTTPGPCAHDDSKPVVGIYGGHARVRAARFGGRTTRDAWPNGHKPVMAEAMGGMDWATCAEISEAIPPSYTQWIGMRLKRQLSQAEAA